MTETLSRRERRKIELISRIEEVAVTLFRDKGCEETTIDDICELSDIARMTFYNHFASKQVLIQALSQKVLYAEAESQILDMMAKQTTTVERLKHFLRHLRNTFCAYSDLERTLLLAARKTSDDIDIQVSRLGNLQNQFAELFREGKARGEVTSKHSPDFLADLAIGAISHILLQWAAAEDFPVKTRLNELEKALCTLIEV